MGAAEEESDQNDQANKELDQSDDDGIDKKKPGQWRKKNSVPFIIEDGEPTLKKARLNEGDDAKSDDPLPGKQAAVMRKEMAEKEGKRLLAKKAKG